MQTESEEMRERKAGEVKEDARRIVGEFKQYARMLYLQKNEKEADQMISGEAWKELPGRNTEFARY